MSKTQHLIGRTLRELGYTGSYVVYGPVTDQESYEEKVKIVTGVDETDSAIQEFLQFLTHNLNQNILKSRMLIQWNS